jgi:flagellar basal body-associated protein FliL
MASNSESESYKLTPSRKCHSLRWIKVGVIAAASALVGGLAAAWWYRKTLKTLSQTDEMSQYPQFGIPFDDSRDEG